VRNDKGLTELLTEFISQYVSSLSSGVCTEEKCGIAFFTQKDEYGFFSVDRNAAFERDPRQLVPSQLSSLAAHAVFVRTKGVVRFSTVSSIRRPSQDIEIEDPISITLVPEGGEPQQWMLSLDSIDHDEEDATYQAFRVQPGTLKSIGATDVSFH